jgi:MinD superfamily P-loop ATPase
VTRSLEEFAEERGIIVAGRVPYDLEVTRAQIARKSVVETSAGPAAEAIRGLWSKVEKRLQGSAAAAVGGLVQLAS